jgi:hypothetical protein
MATWPACLRNPVPTTATNSAVVNVEAMGRESEIPVTQRTVSLSFIVRGQANRSPRQRLPLGTNRDRRYPTSCQGCARLRSGVDL